MLLKATSAQKYSEMLFKKYQWLHNEYSPNSLSDSNRKGSNFEVNFEVIFELYTINQCRILWKSDLYWENIRSTSRFTSLATHEITSTQVFQVFRIN